VRRTHAIIDSPIDPLTLVAQDGVLCGLHMTVSSTGADDLGDRDDAGFADVAEQLAEYFAGERTEFTVPFTMHGNDFQRRVWDTLTRIPYGTTWSYKQLAHEVEPDSGYEMARAVGGANGANPISIIVPCHRVIGSDGSLVGYGGGLPRKRFLLDLEASEEERAARLF
jgi:methylated-DNA-[protein]-cysteine S-methyltransferase